MRADLEHTNAVLAQSTGRLLETNIPRGSYYLGIVPGASDSLFDLSLQVSHYSTPEPEIDPGDVFDSALSMVALVPQPSEVGGYVGSLDERDVYRLSLTADGEMVIALRDVWGSVHATLFADSELLEAADSLGDVNAAPEGSLTKALATGTYFLTVEAPYDDSLYTLSVSAPAAP